MFGNKNWLVGSTMKELKEVFLMQYQTQISIKTVVPNGKTLPPLDLRLLYGAKSFLLRSAIKINWVIFMKRNSGGISRTALRPKLPVWNDVLLPVDHPAEAYFDANSAHCHNLEGSAKKSGLYLSYTETNSRKRGVFKPPIATGKGSCDFIYDIIPGHPEESI